MSLLTWANWWFLICRIQFIPYPALETALQGLDVQFYPASPLYNCSYLTYHLDSHIPASVQPYVSREFQKFNRDQSKRILFPGLSFFLSKEWNDVWINPEECLYIDKAPYFVQKTQLLFIRQLIIGIILNIITWQLIRFNTTVP